MTTRITHSPFSAIFFASAEPIDEDDAQCHIIRDPIHFKHINKDQGFSGFYIVLCIWLHMGCNNYYKTSTSAMAERTS